MPENDKMQGELPVSGNPFTHERIRTALQAAIMDLVVVETHPTTIIRIPNLLIDRLEAILKPFLDNALLARLQEADAHAAKEKRAIVKLTVHPEGIMVTAEAVGNHPAAPISRKMNVINWEDLANAAFNPLLESITALSASAAAKAKACCG